ncbi:MAG: preprotein translocase subunit SecG [Candidatus Daviesbacteria bacterium]
MKGPIFSIIQIVLSVALVGLILIQAKGTGLGSTFGGELGFYRTKRGFEKLLFYGTIGIATLFLITAIVGLLV